ncbi:MAG: hypothetical protein ABSA67_03795 [Candidatus Brocadiia bacterium]|jgi:hypothetical protein
MMMWQRVLATSVILLAAALAAGADEAQPEAPGPYAQWKNGPGKDASYFPLAVWAQEPRDAAGYKKAGINLYIGLEGQPDAALAELKKAGMPVICDQNARTLAHKDDPIIVGWMHGDEPDNAQEVPGSKGYGPPVLPAKIIAEYEAFRKADPSRPVLLNLGRCVACDDLPDRDGRSHHPEDYPEYLKGCDIGSFDIYPVAHSSPPYAGKLDFVGTGVERLIKWTDGRKPVWNCMECTRIHGEDKPTPKQVKAEIWIGLVHGSQGIIYFCHQFLPKEDDHALLDDPPMLAAVGAINKEILELAPALNSPTVKDALKVESSNAEVPLATMVKKQGGATYIFAVTMKPGETQAVYTLEGLPAGAQVEVLGENRKIEPVKGKFKDHFGHWDVHLYRIK